MKKKINLILPTDISLIVYDFDGVMTDNRVLLTEDGKEAVFLSRADGLAVSEIKKLGIKQLILTSEKNLVVKKRAEKLNLEVITAEAEKEKELQAYCERNGIYLKNVVYIGNDLNDLKTMQLVGFSVAPADAAPEILKIAKYVTTVKGGFGVIREFFTLIKSNK